MFLSRRPLLTASLTAMTLVLMACDKEVILPGTRFPVRAPLEASVPVDGQPDPVAPPDQPENQSRPIALPGIVNNADWPARGGNAQHVSPHGSLGATPQLVWAANIGAGNTRQNRVTAAPVVAGGRVFAMDAMSRLTAVSMAGATLWQQDLTADFDLGGGLSGGGLSATAGRVYATTGYGEVVALDAASGAVVWRQRLDSPASGAPTVVGNTVFLTSTDGTGWGVRADTGRVLWHLAGAGAVDAFAMDGGAAPAVDGSTVIFPFTSGLLMAAAADTGASLWTTAIDGERLGRAFANMGDITGDPVVTGGMVYVGTEGGRTGAYREDTGERVWTANEGALNPPLVVGGSVFVVNDEARLVRLDAADGSVIWSVQMPYFLKTRPTRISAISAHYGPLLAGGHILVASSDGLLRLFSAADGTLVAQVPVPGGVAAPPALAGGLVFIVSGKGQLLAFR